MKKVKKVLIWCIPLVLIAVTLMTPVTAQAGGVKLLNIWPDNLIPVNPNRDYSQSGMWVSGSVSGPCGFYAPINLPVGSKIRTIVYYHLGSSWSARTQLILYRRGIDTLFPEVVANCYDDSGSIIEVQTHFEPITIFPKTRYIISVGTQDDTSFFMGAKITYQEP